MKQTVKNIQYNPESKSGGRWVENVSAGLRFKGWADQQGARGIQHKGWYTDDDGIMDTLRGAVYQLPGRSGQPRYVAGYADPCNEDSAYINFKHTYDCEIDAAYAADGIAQQHAEEQREYNTAHQDGTLYAIETDTVAEERKTVRELIAEIKAIRKGRAEWQSTPAVCLALQSQIRQHLHTMRKAQRAANKLLHDYSGASWRGEELRGAFNEGACREVV